jgi:hypothetical protein
MQPPGILDRSVYLGPGLVKAEELEESLGQPVDAKRHLCSGAEALQEMDEALLAIDSLQVSPTRVTRIDSWQMNGTYLGCPGIACSFSGYTDVEGAAREARRPFHP